MAEDNGQPAAATSAPEKRSVGETLREARNAQGVSLEQVATELRIERPQLEALESDRFERIGVPVFVKGYLRQYGARLGLDPRDLLALYHKQSSLKEVQVQPSKTIKLHDERQVTVWVIAALAILVLIVGLAAWWVGRRRFDRREHAARVAEDERRCEARLRGWFAGAAGRGRAVIVAFDACRDADPVRRCSACNDARAVGRRRASSDARADRRCRDCADDACGGHAAAERARRR